MCPRRYFVNKRDDLVTRWNTIVVNAVQVLGNLQVFIVFMTINDLLKVDGEVTIRVEVDIEEMTRVLEGIQAVETDHCNEIRGDRVSIRRHLELRVFGIQRAQNIRCIHRNCPAGNKTRAREGNSKGEEIIQPTLPLTAADVLVSWSPFVHGEEIVKIQGIGFAVKA